MTLPHFRLLLAMSGLGGLLLAGCATYHPWPLSDAQGPQRIADISVSAASMSVPALRASHFDANDGLDVTEVAMLAVAHNPGLRTQRDAAGVASAQAYAAGLLPDPILGYEHDRPTGNVPSGTTTASTRTLTLALGNLVTHHARVTAARASVQDIDLTILWHEWQVIAQARTLFDRVHYQQRLVTRLDREQAALAPITGAVAHSLRIRDLSYATAATGLDAAANVAAQSADARRQLRSAEADLHALLGLDAQVPLYLTGAPFAVAPSATTVQEALLGLPRRRPDLLALKAGYSAQEATLRAAILAQFPAITVGFIKARDNSAIASTGWSIGLSLPIFDGNRGSIRVALATRRQLHDDYDARLLTSRNDIRRLAADLAAYRHQGPIVAEHAHTLGRARDAARAAYAAGRMDWTTYLAIRASSLAADMALLTLDQNTDAAAVALGALAGSWPTSSSNHAESTP